MQVAGSKPDRRILKLVSFAMLYSRMDSSYDFKSQCAAAISSQIAFTTHVAPPARHTLMVACLSQADLTGIARGLSCTSDRIQMGKATSAMA